MKLYKTELKITSQNTRRTLSGCSELLIPLNNPRVTDNGV